MIDFCDISLKISIARTPRGGACFLCRAIATNRIYLSGKSSKGCPRACDTCAQRIIATRQSRRGDKGGIPSHRDCISGVSGTLSSIQVRSSSVRPNFVSAGRAVYKLTPKQMRDRKVAK